MWFFLCVIGDGSVFKSSLGKEECTRCCCCTEEGVGTGFILE